MRKTVSELWARYEHISPYLLIAIVVVVEILATLSPAIDAAFPESGRIALLAAGLLLFFRSIDHSIASIRAPIFKTDFTQGFSRLLRTATQSCDLKIIANDGWRYYTVLSEAGVHIQTVQLIIADERVVYQWWRLVKRGVIDSLEIRRNDGRQTMHCCIANDNVCLVGSLVPRAGGISATKHVLIESDSPGSRELIESLTVSFESLWVNLNILKPQLDK